VKLEASLSIFYAVRSNEVSIVSELLKCGADPHMKDIAGTSAYDIAVKKGYTEIVESFQLYLVGPP
jgi:ankyrin repeat protein